MKLPDKPGEYLFYFGDSKPPYYMLLDVVEDSENGETYISEYHHKDPTHWWHLPEPNQFPNAVDQFSAERR